MNAVRAGQTIVLSFGGAPGEPPITPHLWFILSDPYGDDREVVAVKLVTRKHHTDDTLILRKDDHPFIVRESAVDFGRARVLKENQILKAVVFDRRSQYNKPVSAELLKRLRVGFMKSPHTVIALKERCKDLW